MDIINVGLPCRNACPVWNFFGIIPCNLSILLSNASFLKIYGNNSDQGKLYLLLPVTGVNTMLIVLEASQSEKLGILDPFGT